MISAQEEAHRAVDELETNGATFTFRPAHDSLPPTFTYEIPGRGDRRRCRAIIVHAKANPLVWAAVLEEVANRTRETP